MIVFDPTDKFFTGVSLRVTTGDYEGVVGAYQGIRVGGDVALEVTDPQDYDLHVGETLCVSYEDVEVIEAVA